MKIGDMRHRVTLQGTVSDSDGMGGESETWVTEEVMWAKIRPLSGKELLTAQQLESKISHEITVRYRSDVTAKKRLLYDGRTFEIHAVIDIDERHKYLRILCSEIAQV